MLIFFIRHITMAYDRAFERGDKGPAFPFHRRFPCRRAIHTTGRRPAFRRLCIHILSANRVTGSDPQFNLESEIEIIPFQTRIRFGYDVISNIGL